MSPEQFSRGSNPVGSSCSEFRSEAMSKDEWITVLRKTASSRIRSEEHIACYALLVLNCNCRTSLFPLQRRANSSVRVCDPYAAMHSIWASLSLLRPTDLYLSNISSHTKSQRLRSWHIPCRAACAPTFGLDARYQGRSVQAIGLWAGYTSFRFRTDLLVPFNHLSLPSYSATLGP